METDTNEVEITVINEDEEAKEDVEQNLTEKINRYFDNNGIYGKVSQATLEEYAAQAAELDISVGKMKMAATLFVELCYNNGYLEDEEETVFISVLSQNGKGADKVLSRMKDAAQNCLNQKSVNGNVVAGRVTAEEKAQAAETGISVAKTLLINEIIAIDDGYTFDLLKDKTMKELKDILSECTEEQETEGGYQSGNRAGKGQK